MTGRVQHRYTLRPSDRARGSTDSSLGTRRGKIGCRPVSLDRTETRAMLCFGVYALFCVVGWCLTAVLIAVMWS
jgi:hypothetical protein